MSLPENKSYSAQMLHRGAMNDAKVAREANTRGDKDSEQKSWEWALESELKALNYLLSDSRDPIDSPNIILFSKHAAIYADNTGDKQMALKLLKDALARDPDPKTRDELLRLIADMQSPLNAASEQSVGGSMA